MTTPTLHRDVAAVKRAMHRAGWITLRVIQLKSSVPMELQSISARVRDLRKDKFGGHQVQRRYIGHGQFQYRLVLRKSAR